MTICNRDQVDTKGEFVSYGVTDRLGRVIGTAYRAITVTYTPTDATSGYTREPGVMYGYQTQATRNGKSHQASHYKEFKTEAERDAALEKSLKDARKRAEHPLARTKA